MAKLREEIAAYISGLHAYDPEFARETLGPLLNDYNGFLKALVRADAELRNPGTGSGTKPPHEQIANDVYKYVSRGQGFSPTRLYKI